jgi:hypothetical protein
MHFSVNCSDDPNASLEEFKLNELAPVYESYAWDDAIRLLAGCQVLNVPQLPDVSDQPVASDLPVLLFNGALDPATSPDYGAMIAKYLPNSQNILFPAAGHGQATNPCAMSILTAFAKDPTAKVDTSCIPPKIVFVPIDASATSPDGKAAITMTLPSGFVERQGQWLFGTGMVALIAFPAGTTTEQALENVAKLNKMPFDAAQVKDTAPIAGRPAKTTSGDVMFGTTQYGYDLYAIANPAGAYVVVSLQSSPSILDTWRQQIMPALLNTVKVTQ